MSALRRGSPGWEDMASVVAGVSRADDDLGVNMKMGEAHVFRDRGPGAPLNEAEKRFAKDNGFNAPGGMAAAAQAEDKRITQGVETEFGRQYAAPRFVLMPHPNAGASHQRVANLISEANPDELQGALQRTGLEIARMRDDEMKVRARDSVRKQMPLRPKLAEMIKGSPDMTPVDVFEKKFIPFFARLDFKDQRKFATDANGRVHSNNDMALKRIAALGRGFDAVSKELSQRSIRPVFDRSGRPVAMADRETVGRGRSASDAYGRGA